MPRIFLSYRRSDAAAAAGLLYEQLVDHFGTHYVFRDTDAIRPGQDFIERLDRELESTAAVVALIGENWLSAIDADGKRRLDNPNDYVRYEIARALERDVRIIPVVVDDTSPPREDELPPDLRALAKLQAVELPDRYWKFGVRELIETLEEVVGRPPKRDEDLADLKLASIAEAERLAYSKRKTLEEFLTGWKTSPEPKVRDKLEKALAGEAPLVAAPAVTDDKVATQGVLVATATTLCFIGPAFLLGTERYPYDRLAKVRACWRPPGWHRRTLVFTKRPGAFYLSVATFRNDEEKSFLMKPSFERNVRGFLETLHSRTPDGTVDLQIEDRG